MKFMPLLITICAILAGYINEHANASEGPDPLYLTHATLIDGTGADARPNTTILLQGGTIVAIFSDDTQPLDDSIPAEDLSGRFVIPGLIDNHHHVVDGPPDDLHKLLQEGITTFRDPSAHAKDIKKMIASVSDGLPIPHILHGPIFAGSDFDGGGWIEVTPTSDLNALVKQVKDAGSTGIKIYTDLSAEQVHGLAQAARDNGLAVWSHLVISPATSLDAIEAGVSILSHAAFTRDGLSPEEIDDRLNLMKERGAALDATLRVYQYETDDFDPRRAAAYSTTRRANELGVLVIAGTDDALQDLWEGPDGIGYAGGRIGLYEELELLVDKSGFSPMEALLAATANGAKALGLADTLGTVEVGKTADLVVLSANPLKDIRNARKVVVVFKNGQRVEPLSD